MSKLLFVLLLLFTSSAFGEYQWSVENPTYTQVQIHLAPDPRSTDAPAESANAWTAGDTYREVAFQLIHIVDWGQTRYIAQNPELFHEKDYSGLIGSSYPTVERVDTVMTGVAIAHFAISKTLIHYNFRTAANIFQYVTIFGKLNSTVRNASIGIKVSF